MVFWSMFCLHPHLGDTADYLSSLEWLLWTVCCVCFWYSWVEGFCWTSEAEWVRWLEKLGINRPWWARGFDGTFMMCSILHSISQWAQLPHIKGSNKKPQVQNYPSSLWISPGLTAPLDPLNEAPPFEERSEVNTRCGGDV